MTKVQSDGTAFGSAATIVTQEQWYAVMGGVTAPPQNPAIPPDRAGENPVGAR